MILLMMVNFCCIFRLIQAFKQLLPHTMNFVALKLNVLLLQMYLMKFQVVKMPYKVMTWELFARHHVEVCLRVFKIHVQM